MKREINMITNQITKKDFYFCYSIPLRNFLKAHKMNYLLSAKSLVDDAPFYLFLITEELSKLLHEWTEIQSGQNSFNELR